MKDVIKPESETQKSNKQDIEAGRATEREAIHVT